MHTKFWNSLFLVEIVHPLRPWPEKLGPSWWGETQLRSWTPRRLLTTTTITSLPLPLPPLLLAIVLWNLPMSSTISPLLVYSLYLNSHDMFFYFFWWWLFFFIWCVWSCISVCYLKSDLVVFLFPIYKLILMALIGTAASFCTSGVRKLVLDVVTLSRCILNSQA